MADRIEKLMADWEPKVRDAVLASFRQIRDRVEIARLKALIKAGDVAGTLQAIGLDPANFRPLSAVLAAMFEAGGLDATAGIKVVRGPLGFRIAPLFDVRAPSADFWIRTHTTDLIRQITEDQRVMVAQAMLPLTSGADPLLTGDTPQKIALDLVGRVSGVTGHREGGLIGLTSQQAEWARRYEIELGGGIVPPDANALTRKLRDKRFDRTVAKAIREGTPIPAKTREAMAAAYRNRTLRYRAETIALNEASTSLHQSQIEAWDQAVGRGAVAADKVKRFWITAGDDHVRPLHRKVPGMNKDGVGLHQEFQTPKGPAMQPGWRFDPGCRCRVRVRVIED
jgi:hypothetical protein